MMKEEKKKLRKEVLERIHALPETYCTEADAGILRQVTDMPEYRAAGTVFCYVGMDQEIDTKPIITRMLADGKRVAVPRCVGRGVMNAYEIHTLSVLEPGMMGILEPPTSCTLVEPEELQLVLVPCVTCTARGERLGYGGGFYDRYLEKTSAFRSILVRSRVMEEAVPMEEHDLCMDAVITELGRINCRR